MQQCTGGGEDSLSGAAASTAAAPGGRIGLAQSEAAAMQQCTHGRAWGEEWQGRHCALQPPQAEGRTAASWAGHQLHQRQAESSEAIHQVERELSGSARERGEQQFAELQAQAQAAVGSSKETPKSLLLNDIWAREKVRA